MTHEEILQQARDLLRQHANGDPDRWWYANRFVFARLMLDERKTKAAIKKRLMEASMPCHGCGKAFESAKDIHLHRLDDKKGYSQFNCVLMHPQCHRDLHAGRLEASGTPDQAVADSPPTGNGAGRRGRHLAGAKVSKRYEKMPFLYWWDISPSLAESLGDFDVIEFAKKDTGERCTVPVDQLRQFLQPDRRTSRGEGNWGIKVLREHPDELAFEPPTGRDDWLFLPIEWLLEADD